MDKKYNIPFNKPYMTGKEIDYIKTAHANSILAGDGPFTHLCHDWIETNVGANKALLTHSCTAALEICALLLDIKPGDEIIMPSYTFVSTANAFVLRGAVPVFIDIREDTLNIDESLIESAITSRTIAIVPVHYAGVACDMDSIIVIARKYNLTVIEDAAQGVMSHYKGKSLGSIGDLGAFSFHETKNVISGEGGSLLVNNPVLSERAEIIREKGTDRSRFFRGVVDKYTWQEAGSSFLPGELIAAFLYAQLEEARVITERRLASWNIYHDALESFESRGWLKRPIVPDQCEHNAHMYYIILSENLDRAVVLNALKDCGINALFHYVPLHSSPGGIRYGRISGEMGVTNNVSQQLIRLPLWVGLKESEQIKIVNDLRRILEGC
ncbi:dTDP-4-amino-4,6-dideoxygalactose transaminase [Eionea flava]